MNSKRFYPRRTAACSLTGLLLLTVVGCGSGEEGPVRASVFGTVLFDGKPLEKGTIRFVPIEGTEGQKTSTSIHAGSFVLPAEAGPVVGEHRVEIEAPAAGDLAMDDEEALEKLAAAGKPVKVDFPVIPAVYNTRSTLKKTVSEGEDNVFTFELSSKPPR